MMNITGEEGGLLRVALGCLRRKVELRMLDDRPVAGLVKVDDKRELYRKINELADRLPSPDVEL